MNIKSTMKCKKCIHYIQHYNFSRSRGFNAVGCGHCTKLKKLISNCEYFLEGENEFCRDDSFTYLNALARVDYNIKEFTKRLKQINEHFKKNI